MPPYVYYVMTSSTFTLNMLHKIVKKFAFRMTVSLTLALITTVALFNLAESIPSTFCITRICTVLAAVVFLVVN